MRRGDMEAARRTTSQAISLAIVLGIGCLLLLESRADEAIRLVSGMDQSTRDSAQIANTARDYLRIRALGIPFSLVSTATGGAFRGLLDTRTPLTVAAAVNAVNLVLDPLFIFGFAAFPALGAPGAAAATVVAEMLGAAALLSRLQQSRIGLPSLRVPQLGAMQDLAVASGAVLLRTVALQATLLLSTSAVSRGALDEAGSISVAAHQITLQSFFFLSYLMDSVAVAANGLVADSLGRGQAAAASQAAQRAMLYAFGISGLVGPALLLNPGLAAAVFSDSTDVQAAAAASLAILAIMQPVNAVVFVGDGVFQGAADFKYLAAGMVVACSVAALAIAQGGGDLEAVWLALAALQLVRAVTLAARFWDLAPMFGPSPVTRKLSDSQ